MNTYPKRLSPFERSLIDKVRERLKEEIDEEEMKQILCEIFLPEKDELPNGAIHGFESNDLFED